jgi:hypothetical protein
VPAALGRGKETSTGCAVTAPLAVPALMMTDDNDLAPCMGTVELYGAATR